MNTLSISQSSSTSDPLEKNEVAISMEATTSSDTEKQTIKKTSDVAKSLVSNGSYKFQIEEKLTPILLKIEKNKERQFSLCNMTRLTTRNFLKEASNKPIKTIAKASLIGIAIACLHPLSIGSIASFNSYRLEDWNNMYSNDTTTASNATQLYANLGHGVGYLIEGIEILGITSAWMFWKSYKTSACEVILNSYGPFIQSSTLTNEEREFLHERMHVELRQYGLVNHIPVKNQ